MAGAVFHGHITANATEEFKIVRPFGDNGNEAENWSVNLLHPYPGNVSLIGDCLKLRALPIEEGKAVAEPPTMAARAGSRGGARPRMFLNSLTHVPIDIIRRITAPG